MTKADIVEIIAEKTGFTAKDVKLMVEQFLDEIKNCLRENKHLEIRGFGTFKVKNHKAKRSSYRPRKKPFSKSAGSSTIC